MITQQKYQFRCFCRFFWVGLEGKSSLGVPSFDIEALIMAFGDLFDETRSTRQAVANRRGTASHKLLGDGKVAFIVGI